MQNLWSRWETRPDWMTVTGKYEQIRGEGRGVPDRNEEALALATAIRESIFAEFVIEGEPFVRQRPPKYYRYAFALKASGVVIAFGGLRQGWMVQFHGHWWSTIWRDGFDMSPVIRNNLKVTRFDWSLTIQPKIEAGGWARHFFQHGNELNERLGRKTPRWHYPHAEEGEETYYAGSRESEKFFRVYDKVYWDGFKYPAVRLEMEYKYAAAPTAFMDWYEGKGEMSTDMLCHVFTEDNANWPLILLGWGDDAEFVRVRPLRLRPETSRERWFNEQIKAAFKNWAEDEPTLALQWARDAGAYVETGGWGEPKE